MKPGRSLFTFSQFYIPPFFTTESLLPLRSEDCAHWRADSPTLLFAKQKETF